MVVARGAVGFCSGFGLLLLSKSFPAILAGTGSHSFLSYSFSCRHLFHLRTGVQF